MDTHIDVPAPDVKPGEHTDGNARGWKFFLDEINKTWTQAETSTNTGQLLIEAKEELERDAYNALVNTKLVFDLSVAKKLIKIAENRTLGAHVHQLPPCWSTLYELSKLDDDFLKAKLADGTIHPGMQRRAAIALRKPEGTQQNAEDRGAEAEPATNNSSAISKLDASWKACSIEQRRDFLDQLGRDGLCGAMSERLKAEFQDAMNGATIAGASESAPFAIYATDKLHCALRCAEQQHPDQEGLNQIAAALGCIAKKASAKGITRSRIVVAEGKPRRK